MQEEANNSILRISIFNSLIKFLQQGVLFFLAVFLKDIGFSGIQIGTIFTVYFITGLISVLPSGISNDKFKSKHLLAIALILSALQYLGLSLTTSFLPILIIFFFGGIGRYLYSTSMDSLFIKSTEKEGVAGKIGTYHGLNYLMTGLGIISAGYLLQINFQFEKILMLVGILFLIFALISIFILPSNKTAHFEVLKYSKDIMKPEVLFFLLIMFLFSIHFGSEETSYGLFLREYLHLNNFETGLYIGLCITTMAITVQIIGRKFSHIKAKNLLLFGTLLSGAGLMLTTLKSVPASFIFRMVHETGDAAMFFFSIYGISQLFQLERIGGNASMVTFVTIIGGSLGSLIFGQIGASYGYNFPFVVGGITTLIAFLLTIRFTHLVKH